MTITIPAPFPKFVPAGERAARELAKTGGALMPTHNGRLVRLNGSDADWDVGAPWMGNELKGWTKRVSLWDKMITVSFYIETDATHTRMPLFTLALTPPLTDEEVATAADTYLVLLNMVREEFKNV